MAARAQYDGFAYLYDFWVGSAAAVCEPHLAYYGERYARADGLAVELGVGNGRLLIEGARRGARRLIGVDDSPEMLELCRARVAEAGVGDRIALVRGDFADFELPEPAALIAIPFRSLGHVLTLDDKRRVMRHVLSRLRPGGRFLFDHFVFSPDAAARFAHPVLRGELRHPESGRRALVWVNTEHDRERQLVRVWTRVEELEDDGVLARTRVHRMELSWMHPAQSRELLEDAGFEVEACYGDFDATPFGPESGEQVWVARAPLTGRR